jgi:hypothetical protein
VLATSGLRKINLLPNIRTGSCFYCTEDLFSGLYSEALAEDLAEVFAKVSGN